VFARGVHDEAAPAAPDIQVAIARLHLHGLADGLELSSLRRLQRFARIAKNCAGVDHAFAEEGTVEIIAAIINGLHLVAISAWTMAEFLTQELAEVELQIAPGEAKTEKLVAPEQYRLQVYREVEPLGDVRLVHLLHRQLPPAVGFAFARIAKAQYFFPGSPSRVVPVRPVHEVQERQHDAEERDRKPNQREQPIVWPECQRDGERQRAWNGQQDW
jgi:hypothetical protein